MNLYVITHRETRKPAMVSISSNGDAEFCNDSRAEISAWGSIVAAYTDKETAEKILSRAENVGWYNSSHECPEWSDSFNPLDYEVVAVSL